MNNKDMKQLVANNFSKVKFYEMLTFATVSWKVS